MRKEFVEQFKKLSGYLMIFFQKELIAKGKFHNIQSDKRHLLNDTGMKAWLRLIRLESRGVTPGPNTYEIETIIHLAKADALREFISPRKRERQVFYEPVAMEQFFGIHSIEDQIDASDYLSKLSKQTDSLVWKLLVRHGEGHPYKEISALLGLPASSVGDKIRDAQSKFKNTSLPKPPDSQDENS